MAARWHELVGTQERGTSRPSEMRGGRADSLAGGNDEGIKRRCSEIVGGRGMIGPGKEQHPCLLLHLLGERARLNARGGGRALLAPGRLGKW